MAMMAITTSSSMSVKADRTGKRRWRGNMMDLRERETV
jgi:hypothetical protein